MANLGWMIVAQGELVIHQYRYVRCRAPENQNVIFMPYTRLLGEKTAAHEVSVWLFNMGWSGGPYGIGHRMAINHARAMVHATLGGALDQVPTRPDPIFGLGVPMSCPDVPTGVMDPHRTSSDPKAYDAQAQRLAGLFVANLGNSGDAIPDNVWAVGPRVR